MSEIQIHHQTTHPQFIQDDDDSETIEMDMEEFFKNEEHSHQLGFYETNSQNPSVSSEIPRTQLPSLTNVLGSSVSSNNNVNNNENMNNLNAIKSSVEINNSLEAIFPEHSNYSYHPNHHDDQCPIPLPNGFTNNHHLKISSSLKPIDIHMLDDEYLLNIHRDYKEYDDIEDTGFYPSEVKTRSMKKRQLTERSLNSLKTFSSSSSATIEYSDQLNTNSKHHDYYKVIPESNHSNNYSKDSEEKKPKKQFKTEPRRLTYLREKKIYGRNEESEIINGLQYLLVNNHEASFDYVKEKRSKKTIKFRMPYSMTFRGKKYLSSLIAEMGEQWLIDRGLCMKCNEKIVTAKRIQRSKEAEVNGGLICILHSFGYDFEFKKLKDKLDRKTTPFVKISHFKYPNEKEWRNVDELKKLGRKYNDIMLMQEDQLMNQN